MDSFQDLKLGVGLESFKKKYPNAKVGLCMTDCKKISVIDKDYPRLEYSMAGIEQITYKYFNVVKKTESGDIIYLSLGFYKDKLGLIKVIYGRRQIMTDVVDALKAKYGKESSKSIEKNTYTHTNLTSYRWTKANVAMTYTYNENLNCEQNSELIFIDLSIKKLIENDNLKQSKKRIE